VVNDSLFCCLRFSCQNWIKSSNGQKHLREFDTSDLYKEEMKAHEFSSNMLLGKTLGLAANGDFKAMKFYITVMERRQQNKESLTTNNFVQINNIYVSEDTIKSLPEAKRDAIEDIILSENLKLKLPKESKLESLQKFTSL